MSEMLFNQSMIIFQSLKKHQLILWIILRFHQ